MSWQDQYRVVAPTKYDPIISLKTATTLGLIMFARADEMIEIE